MPQPSSPHSFLSALLASCLPFQMSKTSTHRSYRTLSATATLAAVTPGRPWNNTMPERHVTRESHASASAGLILSTGFPSNSATICFTRISILLKSRECPAEPKDVVTQSIRAHHYVPYVLCLLDAFANLVLAFDKEVRSGLTGSNLRTVEDTINPITNHQIALPGSRS